MTTTAENELLTRVGPGTPMGALMRQYWLPACLSTELTADGDPLRLMLLGEKLIAFRDSAGRIGSVVKLSANAQSLQCLQLTPIRGIIWRPSRSGKR